jgi:hypothetical protein
MAKQIRKLNVAMIGYGLRGDIILEHLHEIPGPFLFSPISC